MKKDTEILNKYFEEARKSKELFSHDEARNLLENHIASKSSSSDNKFWKTITRMKPMNIITSAAASVAIIGMISFGILGFDSENKENSGKLHNAENNSTKVINYHKDKILKDNDNKDTNPVKEIAVNENKDDMDATDENGEKNTELPTKLREIKKVNIKGINAIQLSENELANLGIEIIKNESYNTKNPYGLAYCDKWIRKKPVRTVVMKDFGVIMDSNMELPDANNCVSPRIITDNKGNRRVEVFDDDEYLTTKTFYDRSNHIHKDDNGKEVKIKTNKTTKYIHQKNRNKEDIDKELTTDIFIEPEHNVANSKPVTIRTNVIVDDSIINNDNYTHTFISGGVNSKVYIKNDSIIIDDEGIIDSNRLNDLNMKIKKYKFNWHEEEFEELKEQLESMELDQQTHKEMNERIKEMNKNLREKLEVMNGRITDSVRFFIFPDSSISTYNLNIPSIQPFLDSLKNTKFRFDTTMKFFFKMDTSRIKHDIEIEELQGPDKDIQKHHKFMFANKLNRIEKDINNYIKVNKLIPVEVPIEENGDDFSFILWFDPTQEFMEKLPARVSYMLEDELEALRNTSDVCATPVKGDEAILDIWRSCSGAIENLHVFPNPADGNVNIQFNLTEKRDLRISLHDLYGKRIETIDNYENMAPGLIRKNISLGDLAPGMYLIALESKTGEQAVQRIIVE